MNIGVKHYLVTFNHDVARVAGFNALRIKEVLGEQEDRRRLSPGTSLLINPSALSRSI
jgi:hypothetical protein